MRKNVHASFLKFHLLIALDPKNCLSRAITPPDTSGIHSHRPTEPNSTYLDTGGGGEKDLFISPKPTDASTFKVYRVVVARKQPSERKIVRALKAETGTKPRTPLEQHVRLLAIEFSFYFKTTWRLFVAPPRAKENASHVIRQPPQV